MDSRLGSVGEYGHWLPPDMPDINQFAVDCYRSSAITAKWLRDEHAITENAADRVLRLSGFPSFATGSACSRLSADSGVDQTGL